MPNVIEVNDIQWDKLHDFINDLMHLLKFIFVYIRIIFYFYFFFLLILYLLWNYSLFLFRCLFSYLSLISVHLSLFFLPFFFLVFLNPSSSLLLWLFQVRLLCVNTFNNVKNFVVETKKKDNFSRLLVRRKKKLFSSNKGINRKGKNNIKKKIKIKTVQ